jgi:hypothetical protein
MARLIAHEIALAPDERRTLASLAEHRLEPAGERLTVLARTGASGAEPARRIRDAIGEVEVLARAFEAAEAGVIDVGDPLLRGWLGGQRDELLATLRDDRVHLYDTLAECRARAVAPDDDPDIAQCWRLVDEDLEALALVARLLSDALDEAA